MTKRSSSFLRAALVCAAAFVFGSGCGSDDSNAEPSLTDPDAGADAVNGDAGESRCQTALPVPGEDPLERLSDYCFFGGDPVAHIPNDDVLPYDVNSTLFADDTLKFRFIALPQGTSIGYHPTERWEWPVGATIIKTFYYPLDDSEPGGARRILETRLLVNEGDEWASHSYRWDDEQTDAEYTRLGHWVDLDRVVGGESVSTRYRIPDRNSCSNCHAQNDKTVPLGPRTWQMNKDFTYPDGADNQLERLAARGWLDGFDADPQTIETFPKPFEPESGDLDTRARAYLDANCGHCHNPEGAGGTSGLDLSWTASDPYDYGVCKRPVAAGEGSGGLFYDIVPGDAESSILIYRMASEDPGFKMPELPTLTSHAAGVELISAWINAMEPAGCPER
jgi:uncharacterized repeat protein (TIGR03806 family)